jgi:hypothetical protein
MILRIPVDGDWQPNDDKAELRNVFAHHIARNPQLLCLVDALLKEEASGP